VDVVAISKHSLSADKGHTCERSRNPDGSLSGADRSTAADADLWDADDVFRQVDNTHVLHVASTCDAAYTHLQIRAQSAG
jgi:hypothetical protein